MSVQKIYWKYFSENKRKIVFLLENVVMTFPSFANKHLFFLQDSQQEKQSQTRQITNNHREEFRRHLQVNH